MRVITHLSYAMAMVRRIELVNMMLFRGYRNFGNSKANSELSSSNGHLNS